MMKLRIVLPALCAASLLGSCAFTVDESYFFQPQSYERKAQDPSEMKLGAEERLTGPNSKDEAITSVLPALAERLPATVTHEFVELGRTRIAVSRVKAANGADSEPLIVSCAGNASDRIRSGLTSSWKLLSWGEALLFDYPGYGDSTGAPIMAYMQSLQKDMPGYIDTLATDRPLVLWGHSLGGLICAELARSSREVDAIVLETSGVSSAQFMKERKPWFTPPFLKLELVDGLSDYDVPDALAGFEGPILVLGAGKDAVLPVRMARSLAEELKAKGLDVEYREYEGADHGNAAMNSYFANDAAAFFARVADRN